MVYALENKTTFVPGAMPSGGMQTATTRFGDLCYGTMVDNDDEWNYASLHVPLQVDSDDDSTISGLSDSESDTQADTFFSKSYPLSPCFSWLDSSCAEGIELQGESVYVDQKCCTPLISSSLTTVTPYSKFSDMPDELMCHIGTFLDVQGLTRGRLLNRRFCQLWSRDELWTHQCLELWKNKVHVDPRAKALVSTHHGVESKGAMKAYQLSCIDARCRQDITLEELCFDPFQPAKRTIWHFRFKESAGPAWTSFDPWHRGQNAREMVFLPDGTVRQLVRTNSDGTEDVQYHHLRLPFSDAMESAGLEIRWKFVRKPIDLPSRGNGAYIRLNVGGRDVPTYVVQRSPNGNWGFLLENCWGVFASFPLPQKVTTSDTERGRGLRDVARRREITLEIDEPVSKRRKLQADANLLGDSSLSITNGWQWREALLYNLGASTLPDGASGAIDLDLSWERPTRPAL